MDSKSDNLDNLLPEAGRLEGLAAQLGLDDPNATQRMGVVSARLYFFLIVLRLRVARKPAAVPASLAVRFANILC
jgi:hypothetical protein